MDAKPMPISKPDPNDKASYGSMLRSMSAFGSVQLMQTAVQLVKSKCIAVLLGPAGMGVSSLLVSSSAMIRQLCAAGTPVSAARDIALHQSEAEQISRIAIAIRRMALLLGLAGVLICVCGSQLLSMLSFGSKTFAWAYCLVGLSVGIGILSDNERAMLQGRQQVKQLSWATLWSSLVGLCVAVPLYWLWGVNGIAPAMVLLSLSMWAFYRYHNRGIATAAITWRECFGIMRPLIAFGVMMMGAQLLTAMGIYAQNVYIRACGNASDVGLFQASTSICTQYAGVIFAAMAMDYFPRLTSAITDPSKWHSVISRQTQLVATVTAPLCMLLILTAPLVVRVLLASDFLGVVPLLRWMGLGVYLQALSYPAGYVMLAKGNKHLFFWLEGIGFNVLQLCAICYGYAQWGLWGIGIAFVAVHGISVIVYAAVNARLYSYRYPRAIALQSGSLLAPVAAVMALSFFEAWWSIAASWALMCLVGAWSLRHVRALWHK